MKSSSCSSPTFLMMIRFSWRSLVILCFALAGFCTEITGPVTIPIAPLVVGTDPGGSDVLRVGGSLRTIGVIDSTLGGNFTVGGTSANFYPVLFSNASRWLFHAQIHVEIYRDDVHVNGNWLGSFRTEIIAQPGSWGHRPNKIIYARTDIGFGSPYNDPVGDAQAAINSDQLIVWLRGGATYSYRTLDPDTGNVLADGNPTGVAKTGNNGETFAILTAQRGIGLLKSDALQDGVMRSQGLILGSDPSGTGLLRIGGGADVKGTIRCKEVVVTLAGWADNVFSADYHLPTLSEVQRHIRDKNTLPGIPSESEVVKNGLSLGEMQRLHMAKIEELTLYAIHADEKILRLDAENAKLSARLAAIERALAAKE